MICKECRLNVNENDIYDEKSGLCFNCFESQKTNENVKEMIDFLLKHCMDFKKVNFEGGEGFYLDLGNGIIINFYKSGRVDFEYDEDLKELGEKNENKSKT